MAETAQIAAVTLACPDPAELAEFYRQATGAEIIYSDEDAAYLATPSGVRIGFHRASGFAPPAWRSDEVPQMRLDLGVDDLAVAGQRLLELGATRPGHHLDTVQWIYLADPVGHPFCVTTVF